MYRPFAFVAQGRHAPGRGDITFGIIEIAERPVDGAQPERAASRHDIDQGGMPLVAQRAVALVVGVQPADVHGARPHAGGIVRHTEVQRFETRGRLRDRHDVGPAQRGLDQALYADFLFQSLRLLDLGQQAIHHIHVRRRAHLGDQHGIEPGARLFDDIHDVAVHVMRIQPIDAHRHGFSLPVDVVQGLDDVFPGLGLVIGYDRVLAIQEDEVRGGTGRFLEHAGVGTGHGKFTAL